MGQGCSQILSNGWTEVVLSINMHNINYTDRTFLFLSSLRILSLVRSELKKLASIVLLLSPGALPASRLGDCWPPVPALGPSVAIDASLT